MPSKRGLYENIDAKRKRIKAGSGEKMRKAGEKGAPTDKAFKAAAKTANKPTTCLLYTSPSPRDGLLSRMPSSA